MEEKGDKDKDDAAEDPNGKSCMKASEGSTILSIWTISVQKCSSENFLTHIKNIYVYFLQYWHTKAYV